MSEPVRILLRVAGLLMFLVGIACIVVLFKPGPGELADWMGKSCDHNAKDVSGPEQCTTLDVILIVISAPVLILIGGVMAMALGPEREGGPRTLDLSRFRRG